MKVAVGAIRAPSLLGVAVAILLIAAAALGASGCGRGGSQSAAELALEREDLVFVAHALQAVEGQAGAEVRATRIAWPSIVNGLPSRHTGLYSAEIADAVQAAGRLELPQLFGEEQAAAQTGPASGITGQYRTFVGLAQRGWRMIGATIFQIEHGRAPAARFARSNAALYIDSVYDGHFALGQISKHLLEGYEKLGGQAKFGSALTLAEVQGLAGTYDEPHDRLEPHVGVTLGS